MNDKQQLAAMGAQYRLTEEQAKGLAERMPQTGALQVIDDEPLCMAKRIEELEAQVRVMAGLLRDLREGAEIHLHNCTACKNEQGIANWTSKLERIDASLVGKLPEPAVSDATVALSDIASLQRYALGGYCDDFGQDCGAEMEQDDEGEYILLAEALMPSATPNQEAK